MVHKASLILYCITIIWYRYSIENLKKINITKNPICCIISKCEIKNLQRGHCLMSPEELTVFLRPTEAEDRGSRKSVGVKKRGTHRL
jgi:hypothetical protein